MDYYKKYVKYKKKYLDLKIKDEVDVSGIKIKKIEFKKEKYFDSMIKTVNKIPMNRIINKSDLKKINNSDLKNLVEYIALEFVDKHSPLYEKYSLYEFGEKINIIPNNSLVICPGNSPYKIVKIIELMFMTEKDTYIINGKTKRIRFLCFPLSRPEGKFNFEDVSSKFKLFLDKHDLFEYDNYIYFDHIDSGQTYNYVSQLLRNYFSGKDVKLQKMPLKKIFKDDSHFFFLYNDYHNDRCVAKNYESDFYKQMDNLRRCNIVIINMYYVFNENKKILEIIKKLEKENKIGKKYVASFKNKIHDKFIKKIKIYDGSTNKIINMDNFGKMNSILKGFNSLYSEINDGNDYVKLIVTDKLKVMWDFIDEDFDRDQFNEFVFLHPGSILEVEYYVLPDSIQKYIESHLIASDNFELNSINIIDKMRYIVE